MIFRDKPISVLYFQECLINPPTYPGTLNTIQYLDKLHFDTIGGLYSVEEISERIGDIYAGVCIKNVIASCIIESSESSGNKSETKALYKLLNVLTKKQRTYISLTRQIGSMGNNSIKVNNSKISIPDIKLDMEVVADSAAKGLKILIDARQPDIIMEGEMNVAEDFWKFRYKIMNNNAPSALKFCLYDGIHELTGTWPKNEN